MVTDADTGHFGSLLVSAPYIWTELRHVLKGLTPTCVNKYFDEFLVLMKKLHPWWRADSKTAHRFPRSSLIRSSII